MYTSIEIKGFRCFKHLTIPKLARINLIGGKNNTGKTALLEALAIHAAGATVPDPLILNLYVLRRVGEGQMAALGFRDLFLWLPDEGSATLVAGWDGQQETVQLSCRDTQHTERPLRLEEGTPSRATAALPPRLRQRPDRILVIGTAEGDASVTIGADVKADACAAHPPRPMYFLDDGRHLDSPYVAQGFSDLQVTRRAEPVVELLRLLEPRLIALTVASLGGDPVLHVDLEGGERLVPLPFAGEGMRALCALAVGLAHAPAGIALIDEFGNGLHYSVLPDVWRAIAQAAKDLDVQAFATTHSHECVEAAAEAVPEGELLYHRLDRVGDEIECQTYSPRGLEIAIQTGNEVR
jgi:hypothetical protein